jgi:hypothetical protein
LLHAQVVGYATNFAQAEDDLGPIETFAVGDRVVFIDDPTGPVWRVRRVVGSYASLERPSGLKKITAQCAPRPSPLNLRS